VVNDVADTNTNFTSPTYSFNDGVEGAKYNGARTIEAFKDFLAQQ
jgi:hypothetical protein